MKLQIQGVVVIAKWHWKWMLVITQQIYWYLITVKTHVKPYYIYKYECKLYLIEQTKAQLKVTTLYRTLNKFPLNKLKSDHSQKYVRIATNKENSLMQKWYIQIRLIDSLTSCTHSAHIWCRYNGNSFSRIVLRW